MQTCGLFIVLGLISVVVAGELHEYKTEVELLTDERKVEERLDDPGVPPDNGGNYGDLIYRQRSNQDTLLLRELVLNQDLSSSTVDLRWVVSIPGSTITSVRVINVGRERGYCLRIDVQGGDVQVFIRIPPYRDPRIFIEVYGY
ncbi:unnamed protein product [Acanthoscelides obtectus]|uniref:Uncharacterized protein n=1 Tax=Acanthoscelides obtectus TaxID=200917 RepID=A0A9P0KCS3_ACAOB|nr:unnamed protein product [Acanthoscelides obtectus]CAK1643013.1 hypothetical protein AOBTE_LOCUS13365 [Acanthoscelides obtectus]